MPDKTLEQLGQEVLAAVVEDRAAVGEAWDNRERGDQYDALRGKAVAAYSKLVCAMKAYYAAHKAAQTKSEGSEEHGDGSTQDKA